MTRGGKILRYLLAAALITLAGGDSLAAGQPAASDTTVAHDTSIVFFPYAYYTPETQFAVGAGGIATYYTSKDVELRPSKVVLSGYYTSNEQYLFTLNHEAYYSRNKYYTGVRLTFGHYVRKFFGIGNDPPDLGTEQYVADRWGVELNIETPPLFFVSDRAGLVYDYQQSEIVDPEENPYLLDGDVTGSSGGVVSGIGGDWVWDRRNHSFYPTHGDLHQFKVIIYTHATGSHYTYWTFEHDDRRYIALAPDKVLALQTYISMAVGDAPFDELPALGGQHRMRGYFEGRYRDHAYLMGQVEYRQILSGRLGYVLFAAIGDVAPDITRFHAPSFKFAGGVGLRFLFNKEEKVNLRIDYGRGKDTDGIYFGLEEAF